MSHQELPPFPKDVPTAPIDTVSLKRLREDDNEEQSKAFQACRTHGFFYLNLTDDEAGKEMLDETEQLFDLAQKTFELPVEEKMSYHLEKGVSLMGYKSTGTVKQTDKDQRPDTTEFFNVAKDHVHGISQPRSYPQVLKDATPLIKSFTKDAHTLGMFILDGLARKLGVNPNDMLAANEFNKSSGDHVRMTKKTPHDEDSNQIGLVAHNDFGTITILFNWLGGLQIQSLDPAKEGQWEYVKPLPGHAIINLGDAAVKFSNGMLKSAKHRVVNAPGEQAKVDRYSVVYFVRPADETLMRPLPGLDMNGHGQVDSIWEGDDADQVFEAREWIQKRSIQLGN